MPGVRAVYTVVDLRVDGIIHLPCIAEVAPPPLTIPRARAGLTSSATPRPGSPSSRRRRRTARDAAEAIVVDYDDRRQTDGAAARCRCAALCPRPGQPPSASTRAMPRRWTPLADANDHVELDLRTTASLRHRWRHARRSAASMRRPAASRWRSAARAYSIHISLPMTSSTCRATRQVVAPDVGGGFRRQELLFPEYVLLFAAPASAGALGVGRMEDFLSTAQGRDNRTRARADAEGRSSACGLRPRTGAYPRPAAAGRPMRPAPRWAVCTTFPRSTWMCAAPHQRRCRSTPIVPEA